MEVQKFGHDLFMREPCQELRIIWSNILHLYTVESPLADHPIISDYFYLPGSVVTQKRIHCIHFKGSKISNRTSFL